MCGSRRDRPEEWLAVASSISVERLRTMCSRFRVFQPVKIYKGFHELCTVSHLEAPACLGDRKTQQVDSVSIVAQNHHIRQLQTGLRVLKTTHEMFVWPCANHVIHVTSKDRLISPLCAFLHVRRRIGYPLVVTHVFEFERAVFTPGLRKILIP